MVELSFACCFLTGTRTIAKCSVSCFRTPSLSFLLFRAAQTPLNIFSPHSNKHFDFLNAIPTVYDLATTWGHLLMPFLFAVTVRSVITCYCGTTACYRDAQMPWRVPPRTEPSIFVRHRYITAADRCGMMHAGAMPPDTPELLCWNNSFYQVQ